MTKEEIREKAFEFVSERASGTVKEMDYYAEILTEFATEVTKELENELAISEHDREHNDYELVEVYKKVEQLEKENAELKSDNDARKFAMAMSEKVEKQLREENKLLKSTLYCTTQTCNNCGFVKCENFQRQRKNEPCSIYISYKDRIAKQKLQLTKAEEIIKELVQVEYTDFTNSDYSNELSKVLEKAEQFLNSEVEK